MVLRTKWQTGRRAEARISRAVRECGSRAQAWYDTTVKTVWSLWLGDGTWFCLEAWSSFGKDGKKRYD